MPQPNMILSKSSADKKIRRMALEIIEKNADATELILIGIRDNGSNLAQKISGYIKEIFRGNIAVLELTINKRQPGEISLSEKIDFTDKVVILIDDVANSGRTMLYALQPLLLYIPSKIQTLALVERTHKQFPIHVDYVGLSVSTTLQANIMVEIDNGEVSGAWMK